MSGGMSRSLPFEDEIAPYLTSWADVDGQYRYRLGRVWGDPAERICWIMLNPSTADAEVNDPTIRRCIRFSRDWGFGALVVVNLYALRSTDPKALKGHPDPVGPRNDEAIFDEVGRAGQVMAAWGNHGGTRGQHVRGMLSRSLFHLGLTKEREPRHPLYVGANVAPVRWDA